MNEFKILFDIGCFHVTAYGICLFVGLLLGIGVTLWLGVRKSGFGEISSFALTVMLCAWAGARIVYVATQLPTILADTDYYGVKFILHPWEGGYTLYGAVIGGFAGGLCWCKITHCHTPGKFFDCLVPGAALTLCALRIGEVFTSQGLGHYVEEEFLQFFPFAVTDLYGEWRQPVFCYEATAALAIALVLIHHSRKEETRCSSWEIFLTLLGSTQILFESLREDELIRFGFVRFTQIAAITVVGAVLAAFIVRDVRSHGGFRISHAVRIGVYVCVVIVCIMIEFALDKSTINNHILYAVMAAALAALSLAVLWKRQKITREEE